MSPLPTIISVTYALVAYHQPLTFANLSVSVTSSRPLVSGGARESEIYELRLYLFPRLTYVSLILRP